jgi:transposase-like protein
VIETALDEEMSEHLGYDKHETVGRNLANSRNGKRSKTLLTSSSGDVQIDMPSDRDGTFEPVIVRKRQRRLTDVDAVVLSLYAKGLTTGEISAHFADIYGGAVSRDTVSRITDKVIEEMQAWSNRPLEAFYAAVSIDRALHIMAVVQLRNPTKGRAYFDTRVAAGKTPMEAVRALNEGCPTWSTPRCSPTRNAAKRRAREGNWGRLFNPA